MEFLERRFYFVRAVECYSQQKFPTGKGAICLLGNTPVDAMEFCFPDLRRKGLGRRRQMAGRERRTVLLVRTPKDLDAAIAARATESRRSYDRQAAGSLSP